LQHREVAYREAVVLALLGQREADVGSDLTAAHIRNGIGSEQ